MAKFISHDNINFTQEQLVNFETIAISMMILMEIQQYLDNHHIALEQFLDCIGVTKDYYEHEILGGENPLDLTMLAKFSQKYRVRFNFTMEQLNKDK